MNEFWQRTITALFLCIILAICCYVNPWVSSLIIVSILGYILAVEWPQFKAWPLTLVYPVFPFMLLIVLNQSGYRHILCFFACITFAHDCGAYIIGRKYGRHKICPTVSPGKSWEGFFGGCCIAFAVAVFIIYNRSIKVGSLVISLQNLPLYVLMSNGIALLGDIFESYLKRHAGIKDSGSILPGHGGLLDRLDSLLFVTVGLSIFLLMVQ